MRRPLRPRSDRRPQVRARRPVALAGMLLWLAGAGVVSAQEPMQPAAPGTDSMLANPRAAALDAQAAEIAAQLRCPVCSGQSVLESNAAISQEMQSVIRERLERGDGEAEILAYFRAAYGDWIVLRPRATGWTLMVYVLPAIALLGGAVWVFLLIRRWKAGAAAGAAAGVEAGDGAGDSADGLNARDEAWLRRSIDER